MNKIKTRKQQGICVTVVAVVVSETMQVLSSIEFSMSGTCPHKLHQLQKTVSLCWFFSQEYGHSYVPTCYTCPIQQDLMPAHSSNIPKETGMSISSL
jgi:hypothetical protein